MRNLQMNHRWKTAALALLVVAPGSLMSCRAAARGEAFSSPEVAGEALVAALKTSDEVALTRILGEGSEDLLTSGDPVLDQAQRSEFVSAYETQHAWEAREDGVTVLETGADSWPFPIPLLDGEDGWRFDTAMGVEEILNRRIGGNELNTIQACLAFVDAQREYYERNPRGHEGPEYARFILSTEGERDGLYWPTSGDQAPSPLGPSYASARAEGYSPTQGERSPFHGYLFRVLHAQGPDAYGGAKDYVQGGALTGGFALVAWPARYGSSGVMTFLVNHVGLVYEKDLGPDTEAQVGAMQAFDPGAGWAVVSAEARTLSGG